jgi:adenylate cyclase
VSPAKNPEPLEDGDRSDVAAENGPATDPAAPSPVVPDDAAPLPAERRGALPEDLIGLLLGAPVRYTGEEVAAAARMTLEEVRRLWRAMGFPDVGGARGFTDADLAALLRISALMERGLLDLDSAVDLARSFGQTTSRLTEWQWDTVGRRLVQREQEELAEGRGPDLEQAAREQLAELLPEFERLLVYVWRRHLTAVIGRMWDEFDEPPAMADTATVGFADLVSFTRLTRQLDRDALAMLVQSFETAAADVVHAAGGRLVKTLGDEVLFVADSATVAAEIGLRLHDLSRGDPELPAMRIGLATGPVLMRMGDVFGSTVNRASRLTASARPGTTLLDSDTAEALGVSRDERFSVRAQTPRPIRGLGLLRPYALTRGARRMGSTSRRAGADQAEASDSDSAPAESSTGNT